MDLALELARRTGADLVIANDPDADRAAFAVPDPGAPGGWRVLTGDEAGALLGHLMLLRIPRSEASQHAVANSLVSSRLLARMAQARGVAHVQTLTGFKWISRVPQLCYGYEEALGYCVAPHLVRDKDGISAALLMADYADRLQATGSSLLEVLDQIAVQHGVHATAQLSLRVADLGLREQMLQRIQQDPPQQLAGSPVQTVADLSQGHEGLPPHPGPAAAHRRRQPRRGAPLRHRAEAEVLPGGHRGGPRP